MSSDAKVIQELRAQAANLQAQIKRLAAEVKENFVLYNHAVNSRNSAVAAGRMCSILLREDFTLASTSNTEALLGHLELEVPVTAAIKGPAVDYYFESIRDLGNQLSATADSVSEETWSKVFPSKTGQADEFEGWISIPPGSWETRENQARLVPDAVPGSENYLVSPGEIIGPADDFRVEYMARAEGQPQDLSLVIGTQMRPGVAGVHAARPDSEGYSFAFGAMDNQSTELQRCLETIYENENVLIVPGRDHHCVAERVGGQLRFVVDGREAYCAVDCLPIMGKGYGHVGLYTCAPSHTFWDLSVWTRPTCLPPKTRGQIESLRDTVLELHGSPARFVEVHYMGKNLFLFKDVTKEKVR